MPYLLSGTTLYKKKKKKINKKLFSLRAVKWINELFKCSYVVKGHTGKTALIPSVGKIINILRNQLWTYEKLILIKGSLHRAV